LLQERRPKGGPKPDETVSRSARIVIGTKAIVKVGKKALERDASKASPRGVVRNASGS